MRTETITLYRGDTKKITASLTIDGELQDLGGYTVRLYDRRTQKVICGAEINGDTAIFDINKELSAELPLNYTGVMIVFDGPYHRVSQPAMLFVQEGINV